MRRALTLLVAVEVIGAISKGAQRWIDLGAVQLQPSEIMKIALVLALARYFHGSHLDEVRRPLHLVPPALMILVPAALVLKQPDLGTAVMLLAVGGAMLFLAGVRLWNFSWSASPVLAPCRSSGRACTTISVSASSPSSIPRRTRSAPATTSSSPRSRWARAASGARAICTARRRSSASCPRSRPTSPSPCWARSWAFWARAVVLALFLALLGLAFVIALRSTSQFGRLLAMGISCNLALYVVINVAMVTGMIPVVGVPLPMISYGGTAMLTVLIGCGLLLNVDVHREVAIPRFFNDL